MRQVGRPSWLTTAGPGKRQKILFICCTLPGFGSWEGVVSGGIYLVLYRANPETDPGHNGRFGGQREKEGRLMSVNEGVGTEVYFGAIFRRHLYHFECYTIALVRPPENLTQLCATKRGPLLARPYCSISTLRIDS